MALYKHDFIWLMTWNKKQVSKSLKFTAMVQTLKAECYELKCYVSPFSLVNHGENFWAPSALTPSLHFHAILLMKVCMWRRNRVMFQGHWLLHVKTLTKEEVENTQEALWPTGTLHRNCLQKIYISPKNNNKYLQKNNVPGNLPLIPN